MDGSEEGRAVGARRYLHGRLAVEHDLARDVGIRFKGVEKTNVEEYCVSEGWIRVAAGTAKDRYGNPLTIKLTGAVEPYFRTGDQG